MKTSIAPPVAVFCLLLAIMGITAHAEELKGVRISEATQATSREYAVCVKANAKTNYVRLRKTMFAGAWAAGQAAMIGSGLCKARWDAYESSTAADFRLAGAPILEVAPSLRDVIDAQTADQLLESEAEKVPLCKVQQAKRGNSVSAVPRLPAPRLTP